VSQEGSYRFESGTQDYPFSNLAFAFREVFNYQSKFSDYRVNIILSRTGTHKLYTGLLPAYIYDSTITINSDATGTNRYSNLLIVNDETTISSYLKSLFSVSLAQKSYSFTDSDHIADLETTFTARSEFAKIVSANGRLVLNRISVTNQGEVDSNRDRDYALVQVIDGDNNSVNATRCSFENYAVLYSENAVQSQITNS
jgi:hypothetical protein